MQNRYMKSAKDWGWREFITLQALFDADAGYLLNDDCVFAAEVLMLKESSDAHQVCPYVNDPSSALPVEPAYPENGIQACGGLALYGMRWKAAVW